LILVFDGIDGCGKSTHAFLTADYLMSHGYDTVFLKEPTMESPAGKRLREALQSGNRPLPEEELRYLILKSEIKFALKK
jgi:thymidylate kinase